MIFIYSFLLYLISPLLPLYLKYRGKKNPDYLLNWNERFGINLKTSSNKVIWIHAVSVGETRATIKLIKLLSESYPEYQILITNMTPTGRKTAKSLFPNAIVHYIPYDLYFSVRKFYKTFKPAIGIIMETEIWPNLIWQSKKFKIPLYLANARLSDRSYNGYNRFKYLLMPVINQLKGILCQEENTLNNFKNLGYTRDLTIVGNTKFDLELPENFLSVKESLNKIIDNRKIICFASTRDGEEDLILDNIDLSLDVIYLIIPRHPERFSLLAETLEKRLIKYIRRSQNKPLAKDDKIIIGDSMGEMLAYYAISEIVVIGGSINDFGGQNPLEAFFMDKPVLFGKSMYNFSKIAKDSLDIGCAIQFDNIQNLKKIIDDLLINDDLYCQLKNKCKLFMDKYQGASQKICDIVNKDL